MRRIESMGLESNNVLDMGWGTVDCTGSFCGTAHVEKFYKHASVLNPRNVFLKCSGSIVIMPTLVQ